MEQKIYVSLKEAEDLVFNKIILIPNHRLKITSAQKNLSITLFVANNLLIESNEQLFITSGAVMEYEIPKKEKNLFLNHLKVPKGLISISSRKVRDKQSDEFSFPEYDHYERNIKYFKYIRRGLIQLYDLAINEIISNEFSLEVIHTINNSNELSDFKIKFIKEIVLQDFYPIKERNDGDFHLETFNRFNWLGGYIFKNFPNIKELDQENLKETKEWLLKLKDKDDTVSIKSAIKNVPNIFYEEFEFIMGYYFAASFYEEANIGTDHHKVILSKLAKLKLDKNTKVVFWSIFFQAIFKDDLDFLYLIKSLQKQQLLIEHKILEFLFNDLKTSEANISLLPITENDAVDEYIQLKEGISSTKPSFINSGQIEELFENNFSDKRIDEIGVETNNFISNSFFKNKCSVNRNDFSLYLSSSPNDVTFYLNDDSETKEWLKSLKIKTKPLDKIIDRNKKALVGFLHPETYNDSLLRVYEWLLSNYHDSIGFKKVVIVLLVNENLEYTQSVEFQNKRLEMEKFCKKRFGEVTTVLVKNERVKSDEEIKRNLKHLLENHKIKDIELVNEIVNKNIYKWMTQVNNEYIVKSDIKNYYTLITQ